MSNVPTLGNGNMGPHIAYATYATDRSGNYISHTNEEYCKFIENTLKAEHFILICGHVFNSNIVKYDCFYLSTFLWM